MKNVQDLIKIARERIETIKQAGLGTLPPDPTEKPVSLPSSPPAATNVTNSEPPMNPPITTPPIANSPETSPAPSGQNNPPAPKDGNAIEDAVKAATVRARDLLARLKGVTPGEPTTPSEPAATTVPDATKQAAAPSNPEGQTPAAPTEPTRDLEITRDLYTKIASILLATEEGRRDVERHLEIQIGQQEALNMIKQAAVLQEGLEQAGAAHLAEQEQLQHAYAAHEAERQAFAQQLAAMPAEQQTKMSSLVTQLDAASQSLREDPLGELYRGWLVKGAMDMSQIAEAQMGGQAPPTGEEMNPQMGIEEVLAMLQALVESGEVSPEEAEQIAQILMAEADTGAQEGVKAAAALAGSVVPAPDEEEFKKVASALLPATA